MKRLSSAFDRIVRGCEEMCDSDWIKKTMECMDKIGSERLDIYKEFSSNKPKADTYQDEKTIFIYVEVPGINRSDLSIRIKDSDLAGHHHQARELVIEGERRMPFEFSETQLECAYGKYSRSFHIPNHANVSNIVATYSNGILCIKIPLNSTDTGGRDIKIL